MFLVMFVRVFFIYDTLLEIILISVFFSLLWSFQCLLLLGFFQFAVSRTVLLSVHNYLHVLGLLLTN